MTDTTQDRGTTLVLGGTGKTGRRVAERLLARGLPVRVGSRAGAPPFDWDDRATWAPALRGATSAYVSFFPDLGVPRAAATVGALAGQAVELGVRRLVLLSGRGEEEAQRAERALQQAGGDWTVVRCGWFSQNFSESFLAEPVIDGDIASLMTYLFTEVLDGRSARVTDGVRRALGREPRDFRDYARDAAAAGAWSGRR